MSNNDDQTKFVFNRHSDKIETPKPHQHRCNGHLEDVLDGVSQWPMDVSKPFGIFLDCLKSNVGRVYIIEYDIN